MGWRWSDQWYDEANVRGAKVVLGESEQLKVIWEGSEQWNLG